MPAGRAAQRGRYRRRYGVEPPSAAARRRGEHVSSEYTSDGLRVARWALPSVELGPTASADSSVVEQQELVVVDAGEGECRCGGGERRGDHGRADEQTVSLGHCSLLRED